MKLKKWALIAEIIGAAAIVITLVILILEVRGNTQAIQISNRQSIAIRAQEMALTLARQPEVRNAFFETLFHDSPNENAVAIATQFMLADLKIAEEAYLLYLEGQLSEGYWKTRASIAMNILQRPVLRDAYFTYRDAGFFQSEFTGWLDQALDETYGQ